MSTLLSLVGDRNIAPWVTDMAGSEYSTRGTASGYARWQYGGLSSLYADVNPGNFVRDRKSVV